MNNNHNSTTKQTPLLESAGCPTSPLLRLLTGCGLLLLIILLLASFSLIKSRQQRLDDMRTVAQRNAAVLQQAMAVTVGKVDLSLLNTVDELYHQLQTGGIDPHRLEVYLEQQHRRLPELESLLVSDASGIVRYGSGKAADKPVSISDRDYFIRLKQNRDAGLQISHPLIGRVSGSRAIVVARRLNGLDGSFRGCVLGVVALDTFTTMISQLPLDNNGLAALRLEDHSLLSYYSPHKSAGVHPSGSQVISRKFEAMLLRNPAGGDYRAISTIDGVERHYSYRRVGSYPLYINVGMAIDDALNEWYSQVAWTAAAIVFFIACASVVVVTTQRHWRETVAAFNNNEELLVISEQQRDSLQRYQQALQDSEELLSRFMRHSPIYCYIKEVEGNESRVLKASENFYDMIGITAEKMVGKTMHQLYPAEFADKITADDLLVVAQKRVIRVEEQLGEGTYITYKFPIELHPGKWLVAGYTIDISDRKRVENEMHELLSQTERFRAALDTMSANIYMKDRRSRYIYANKSMLEMFKCSSSELIGAEDSTFFPSETALRLSEMDQRVYNGEKSMEEIEVLTEGEGKRIFLEIKSPLYSDLHKSIIDGVVGISTDITRMKKAEEQLRKMQMQFQQQDKLASIGQLAAGVAHEINNPMAFIGSNMVTLTSYVNKFETYIETLETALKKTNGGVLPESVSEQYTSLKLGYVMRDISLLLQESNDGVEHVKQIVLDLKTFARPDVLKTAAADLNACVDSTLNIVYNELKYFANIIKRYGEIPKIQCNVQQINQVILNLLVNASHAIQELEIQSGDIVITSWLEGDDVCLSVADTGCGIPPERLSKIFDAFYTTKEVGKGTGLGLSISAGIIRKHGGELSVISEVGQGTTFTVRLPVKEQQVSRSAA